MTILKRILSILLSTSILMCLIGATPNPHTVDSSSTKMQEICSYIGSVLPTICKTNQELTGELYLGTPLSTYYQNEDGSLRNCDYDTYPIILDDQVIAIAGICDINTNEPSITLGVDFAHELQEAIDHHDSLPFAIIYKYGGVRIIFSDGTTSVLNDICGYSWESIPETADIRTSMSFSSIQPDFKISINNLEVRQSVTNELDMEYVPSTSTSCCPKGICWAACLAIM